MKLLPSSGPARTVAMAVAITISTAVTGFQTALADTELTINGTEVDSRVVTLYIESRLQQPESQASAEDREALLGELTDIYLLTTQPSMAGLMEDPNIQAQLEIQKRGLMAQVAATDFLARNTATDEEIIAAYTTQIELAPPLQFKARHILVRTQAAAIELVTQLDDGGDFQELARINSSDGSASAGGDLGWFSPENMVPEFSAAVEALEDGSYTSEPVQSQFGWHVILREESRENVAPTLESVRDVIKQRVEQQKLQDYLFELRTTLE